MYNHFVQSGNSVLAGIFESPSGDATGPWSQIADYKKLENSGSALKQGYPGSGNNGYSPGVQAWYNNFITVDPADSSHVYVGLEEVYETRNGGTSWNTIAPYWNFGFACFNVDPAKDTCGPAPHSDQHAVAIAGGQVYIGNDGGVYRRAVNADPTTTVGWANLNSTLHTLQYYYAGSGIAAQAGNGHTAGGDMVWGGLQDNGASLIAPGLTNMVEPFGGDGGDTIVNPANGDQSVQEYVFLDMFKTTNAGYAPGNVSNPAPGWAEITPECYPYTYAPSGRLCDPSARFIAPFRADVNNTSHWLAGGQYVWDNQGKGWATSCASTTCDWLPDYNTGAGHIVTALASNGDTEYASWCNDPCNPFATSAAYSSDGFHRGIATNYGGIWHELDMSAANGLADGMPNRYVSNIVVDKANPAHIYVTLSGFNRRWTPNAGVGHVFESNDGGQHFTDIDGNLPDAPADDVVITPSGKLVLAMDTGVFSATIGSTSWTRLGTGLPNAAVNDLSVNPNGSYLIAATHGRGLWKIATP
jgi:hypothetical protein